ncbi:MAG: AraC family transcriptional regulator, partial [Cyanobacteria bacterium P01_A01_bin.84]
KLKIMNKNNDIVSTLPNLPIISSHEHKWETIQFAYCTQSAFSIPEHHSSDHSICINAGKVVRLEQKIEGKLITIDSVPGDIAIYPAHSSQSFAWDKDAEFLLITLKSDLLGKLGYELYQSDNVEIIPQLGSLFDPLIQQIALALKTSLEIKEINNRLYADSMGNALALHLLSHYSNRSYKIKPHNHQLSQTQLKQVVEYIDSNLDRDLSLAQLAAVIQLSEYYFARLFKQTTGITPHKYHIKCRVERAKKLLLQGINISEVAQTVGFCSQAHLNYHFKRNVGATPKHFLRSLKVGK